MIKPFFQFDNGQPVGDAAAVLSEPSSGPGRDELATSRRVLFWILGVGFVVRLLAVVFFVRRSTRTRAGSFRIWLGTRTGCPVCG